MSILPKGALAVVGMVGRFPGARSVDELWENLCAGREGVHFFKPEELDRSVPLSVRLDPAYVAARGIIEDYDKFDANFFDIPPVEAAIMDPQQRIMLELAWAALENAGHPPSTFAGLIGVYVGMNWNRYRANCISAHPHLVAQFGELQTALANEYDFLATRISYKLNLRGPSLTISTACSTSLVAIAQASQALLNYECDLALAGGASITVPVNAGYLYQEGGMLSADGHCRPFDARSTGTTFSDGAGIVVLRRLEDATQDGDHIYAVVRGFAVNNDGSDKVSFTAPSVNGQADVVRSALEFADIDPATIGFIETHGTATPLGDPIEVAALKKVFASAGSNGARCALGSVKSSVGHLIHAAGVTGFIKAVMSVYDGKIAPTLFFEKPNPRLGLDDSPFYVNSRLKDWEAGPHPRRAGVSSFGVGGTNAHVVIEQAPVMEDYPSLGLPRMLCLSAKTEDALARQTAALKRFLSTRENALSLDALAYTLQSGREPMGYRVAWAVNSVADAVNAIDDKRRTIRGIATSSKETAFMFTGQGTQRPRMGQRLYEMNAAFRQCFDEGAERLKSRTGLDMHSKLFSDPEHASSQIDQTRITQPALFLLEYCLARMLESMGVSAGILLGHSVGEFVAATLAGIFTYDDALYVVAKRGEAMQGMPRGSMLMVNCGEGQAQSYISDVISLAAVNAPDFSVLSGPDEQMEALAAELQLRGVRSKRLRTSHAFHSAMMDPAVEAMRSVLAEIELSGPRRAVLSTVTGRLLTGEQAIDPEYWARQLRETVRFAAALDSLAEMGEMALVEIGPGATLTTLALQHPRADRIAAMPALPGSGVQDGAELEVLSAAAHCWAHGAFANWKQYWGDATYPRVPLPTYFFNRTRHWLDAPQQQGVPGATEKQPEIVIDQQSTGESTAMNDSDRIASIRRRVIKVIEDTTGVEMTGANPTALFVDMGLDSLSLTQIAIQLKQTLKVNITFRQLMEKYRSLENLVTFLDGELPAEQSVANVASATFASGASVGMPTSSQLAIAGSGLPASASLMEQVIQQQMQLMAQQLAMLRGLPANSASISTKAPAMVPPVPPAQSSIKDAAPTAQRVETNAAGEEEGAAAVNKYDVKKAFGAIARIHTEAMSNITERQRARLNAFMRRYVARTRLSKEYTQAHRPHLADPRVVNGFRPLVKEIIYQIVIGRSKGSHLWDLDGNEYVDVLGGFGLNLFGWQPTFITEAVQEQLKLGYDIGPQHPLAGEVAKLICEMTGSDRAGLCNTGSEAVMGAVRIARTVTGRSTIVLFTGSYHGIFDEVIVRGTKNLRAFPAAPGIMPNTAMNVLVLDYGTAESMDIIKSRAHELAAVLVEPIQSRRPDFQPREFLHELRKVTQDAGTLLIFDEVVTGFRCHPGGAQSLFGIRADLCTYGKVVGGGFPIGIIAGKREFMDALDGGAWQYGDESIPTVGVTYFAGTFVRHPLALAAAKAVLNHLKTEGPALQVSLNQRTTEMVDGLNAFCREAGAPIVLKSFSSVWRIFFTEDHPLQDLLYAMMRSRGIHILDNFPCFFTTAHTDSDIDLIKAAFMESVTELQETDFLPRRKGTAPIVLDASKPPIPGARIGKDPEGKPAWFVPNPDSPGKYLRLEA